MRIDQLLPAVAALIVVFLLPRLAQGPRALGGVLGAGIVAAVLGWIWQRYSLLSENGLVFLVVAAAVLLALFLGVLVRATVLAGQKRHWPAVADVVLTGGGVVLLSLSFLRIFQSI